ncbi:MAG TPA: hypothetical protein PLV68_15705, partial [Ilumatobacteraceae bacterium]|nr:hypothetical protein [Ilumatobacteraceae bacterium]
VIVDVLGWFPTDGPFTGLTPARLIDTRPGGPTTDGLGSGGGALRANSTATYQISNRGGIPASGVSAVAINLTAASTTASGYLTVYPFGSAKPTASNLNFTRGQIVPNMAIVPLGPDGRITVYNFSGTTDVVIDVLGYFTTGTAFTGLTPARLLDTRIGFPTTDNLFDGTREVIADTVNNVRIGARPGVPADAGSVVLNVTVTGSTGPGFLTIYPTGAKRPTASNLNFTAGATVANMVTVPLGNGGQIAIYAGVSSVDVIVDVLGWYPNQPTPPPTTALRSPWATLVGTISQLPMSISRL